MLLSMNDVLPFFSFFFFPFFLAVAVIKCFMIEVNV